MNICVVDVTLYPARALRFDSDVELNESVFCNYPDIGFSFSRLCMFYSDDTDDIETARSIVGEMWQVAVNKGWIIDGINQYDVELNLPTFSIGFVVNSADIFKEDFRNRVFGYVLTTLEDWAKDHAVPDGVELQKEEGDWEYYG